MPELPEVETIKRQLEKKIVGKKLKGVKITALRRRAKILMIDFVDGTNLVFHLKLAGQLIFNGTPSPYTRKVFVFDDGSKLYFNDMRKFGWWKKTKGTEKIEAEFGPEPLEIDLKTFKSLFLKRQKSRVKPLLMNQKFIAGIGNIYANEILYLSQVHPLRQVQTLSEGEIKLIYQNIKKVLTQAIKHQGSSTREYVDANGEEGRTAKFHQVYQKNGQKCPRCGAVIKRLKVAGRGTFFCPSCQK